MRSIVPTRGFADAMSDHTRLYLLRHAEAVAAEDDPARPLSEHGRDQVRAIATFIRERGGIAVERVWHSPLIRAVETAEIFCDQLDITATRREIDGLLTILGFVREVTAELVHDDDTLQLNLELLRAD